MKILILGGTGFISSRVVPKLLAAGNEVHIFTRGRSKLDSDAENLKHIIGDRNNAEDLFSAARNEYDAVYDFIAYRPEDTRNAVKAFKEKVGRFIHCSTISVYMISNEITTPVTEDQFRAPVMEFWARNPFGMGYGINKRRCEEILWNEHSRTFPVTIIRPTFVCGPADPARRDYFWIERILDGQPLLVPGNGEYKFQNVYLKDLANIFAKIPEIENTKGQSYNAADEQVLTLNSYLRLLGEILNRDIQLVHCEQDTFDSLPFSQSDVADVFTFNTRRDATFSLEKIKKDLGYTSTPIKVWMTETVEWFLKYDNKHSAGYENRDDELSFIKLLQVNQSK